MKKEIDYKECLNSVFILFEVINNYGWDWENCFIVLEKEIKLLKKELVFVFKEFKVIGF